MGSRYCWSWQRSKLLENIEFFGYQALPIWESKATLNVDDRQWTVKLHDLCKITFGSINERLVEHNVHLKWVSYLENIVDKIAELSDRSDKNTVSKTDQVGKNVPIKYTRTLNKTYWFFRDRHVQEIKYHPMPKLQYHACVSSKLLPSMQKGCVYNVVVIFVSQLLKVHCHTVFPVRYPTRDVLRKLCL